MSRILSPGKTIGILGGGQLGRMMAIAAKAMGFRIAVLEPKSDSPAGQTADIEVEAAYDDREGAKELAKHCDVLTYEFENIDAPTAAFLEETLYLPQGGSLLYTTQHRIREKNAIEEAGVHVSPYRSVDSKESLGLALEELGRPAVLKTCQGGYDGKGQVVIKENTNADQAFETLNGNEKDLVLEAWVPFEKEISVIVTRSTNGEISTFPVGENIHENNILHQTIVPARITSDTERKARDIAYQLAEKLELTGTLAVEMFVLEDGNIYVNELAPRPHNSGHYTIEACETSQFEQHIRAICGWPLGSTNLLRPVVMTNLLGQHLSHVYDNVESFSKNGHLHVYGKDEAKHGRKMGHWTVLGSDIEEALAKTNYVWEKQTSFINK
ncbi:5-(carboxyamino)imidazole ribonucleotide synthase [Alteribacillus bidgolensis]|uniref:N5-carboxyaminoimidazole ribonucleotide synthase n=1 Tax=Alteribacillus bidgolensis TaxID=930129 RepID=A0A1G8KB95_9BACI|nr:5-(carboxyamino)imidazole ribonucleotide synthase [Alteribacillus bidgolensis]SDI40682.1 5-(carboxyamino)imidazole ribonucleotide synthase [Alteribacillus bidgolensis]